MMVPDYTSPPEVIVSDPAGGIGTITASAIAITTRYW